MINTDIPEYLNKTIIFNRHVQIGHKMYDNFEIVITRGPKVYATKGKEIIALGDLTGTILNSVECEQTDFHKDNKDKLCDFDVCFSYTGKTKHVFFLLKMRDKLVVMTKRDDQITVHKEYENVRSFKIEEKYSIVHLRIEMIDGCVTCDDLYRLTTNHPMVDHKRFDGVAKTIAERIATVKAELSTTKLDVQKHFNELGKELRFGPNTLRDSLEERVMLAKFGDIWIKRHNDMLVFGVPVYNCCYLSKRLIENIRVILLSDQLKQFDFTYKLHKFRVDETSAPNYEQILNKEDDFAFPSFDQEWQPSENNNLYPDTAAIIVITTSVPNFIDFAVLEFDSFLEYEIHDDNKVNNLQNYTGKICINSDIFYNPKFLVTFNRNAVYKDLLAVTSTSEFVFIKLVFIEIAIKESFYEFLLNHLEFTKTTESETTEEQAENVDDMLVDKFDFLSTTNVEHHSTDIYFLSKDSSYWNNTLIRTHSQGLVDQLKIYNKCKDRILSLIQSIKCRFDKVSVEFINPRCNTIKLSVLKHALQKEVDFIKNNFNTTSEVLDDNLIKQKMLKEFETDCAYTMLNEK